MQLGARTDGGGTLRDHLYAAARQGAPLDARLTERTPPECDALWHAFAELGSARPAGMGLGAIPPSEIAAWQTLNGVRLTGWELETLMAMDRAALAVIAEQQQKARK
jgi:hypothetical protein